MKGESLDGRMVHGWCGSVLAMLFFSYRQLKRGLEKLRQYDWGHEFFLYVPRVCCSEDGFQLKIMVLSANRSSKVPSMRLISGHDFDSFQPMLGIEAIAVVYSLETL